MYTTLGTYGLLVALAFAIFGMLASALGAARRDARLETAGRRAGFPVFLLTLLTVVALWSALLTNDTSVTYVAQHSASYSPTWVKLVTLWAALEGSILLWAFLTTIYTLVLARVAVPGPLRSWALAVAHGVGAFFLATILLVANPFVPVPHPPIDGPGPNALLQNHWLMAVHPVLMYLGLVGLTVPFAYAVAALVTGRLGDAWITATRRWSLAAWGFLGLANLVGGLWSYEVLGWGGYWAWDPVENVALIPWLLATAFVHSVQIQERRRMLRGWNLGLIIAAFSSSILATFIIRSGIIASVHSFGRGPVGPFFLGFFALIVVGSLLLSYLRLPKLRDENELDHPLSREAAFLTGNVLFVVFAFMTLLGTVFPVLVEALRSQRVSVGAPFFNAFAIPLGWAILLVMGGAPLLPWRHGPRARTWRALGVLLALGAFAGAFAFSLGVRRPAVALTIGLVGYNLASVAFLTFSAARERARIAQRPVIPALARLVRLNPRRYGAYLAHVAIALIALGVSVSGGYKADRVFTLKVGETKTVLGRAVTYQTPSVEEKPDKSSVVARVLIDGRPFAPRLNYYRSQQAPVVTPAIRYGLWGDTYLTVTTFDPQGRWASLRLIVNPFVTWIWLGGLVLLAGTLLTLCPVRQPKPALAAGQLEAA